MLYIAMFLVMYLIMDFTHAFLQSNIFAFL